MTIEKEAEAPQVQESDSDSEKKFRLVDAQWLRAAFRSEWGSGA